MKVGIAIKKIRTDKAITQKELSDRTGISATSLSQMEKGIKRPSAKNLTKICAALNVPEALVYFYGLEEQDIPEKNKEIYKLVFPALEGMIKKLIID